MIRKRSFELVIRGKPLNPHCLINAESARTRGMYVHLPMTISHGPTRTIPIQHPEWSTLNLPFLKRAVAELFRSGGHTPMIYMRSRRLFRFEITKENGLSQ